MIKNYENGSNIVHIETRYLPKDENPGASHSKNNVGQIVVFIVIAAHIEAEVGNVQVVGGPVGAVDSSADGENKLDHEDPEDRNIS